MKTSQNRKQIYFWFYFLAVIALTGVFTSCGKCDPKPTPPPNYKIATVSGYDSRILWGVTGTATLTYDSMNRQTQFSDASRLFSLTYTPSVAIIDLYNAGKSKLVSEIRATLNQQGYAYSYFYYYHTNDQLYDADGHLIKLIYDGDSVIYSYNADGDLTTEQYYTNGMPQTGPGAYYTYTYTAKKDLRVDGMDWFSGKRSTHLPAKRTDGEGHDEFYTYIFDGWGRVMQVSLQGNTTAYTYFN